MSSRIVSPRATYLLGESKEILTEIRLWDTSRCLNSSIYRRVYGAKMAKLFESFEAILVPDKSEISKVLSIIGND
jgi:hypothetical protein